MKKEIKKQSILKVVCFVLGGLLILALGYFLGHKVGKSYGAQQYVKLLWNKGELDISPSLVSEKIYKYREENKLKPFEETMGICAYAQFRAEEVSKKYTQQWNTKAQSYQNSTETDEIHTSALTLDQAKAVCVGCDFSTQRENIYFTARPEVCLTANNVSSIKCDGNEKFGVVENHTDRVVKGWISSPSHNETLLSKVTHGCVASFGGVVVLETY